jgi:trk system potassium uptake protein TrkA
MYVVIAGAGLVGSSLATRLSDAHHDVVVIDSDKAVCEQLAASLGALVLHGSATDVDILERAGMSKADVAVSTMRSDADNLAFALLAKSLDVPRVIARMRNPRYEAAYKKAGVTATSHIVDVFVNQLLLEIDEPHLRQIAVFGAGQASIVVDTVPDGALVSGKSVSDIAADPDFPSECVITGIYRRDDAELVIPRGSAEVREGDRVFLVASRHNLKKASRFLHRKR